MLESKGNGINPKAFLCAAVLNTQSTGRPSITEYVRCHLPLASRFSKFEYCSILADNCEELKKKMLIFEKRESDLIQISHFIIFPSYKIILFRIKACPYLD